MREQRDRVSGHGGEAGRTAQSRQAPQGAERADPVSGAAGERSAAVGDEARRRAGAEDGTRRRAAAARAHGHEHAAARARGRQALPARRQRRRDRERRRRDADRVDGRGGRVRADRCDGVAECREGAQAVCRAPAAPGRADQDRGVDRAAVPDHAAGEGTGAAPLFAAADGRPDRPSSVCRQAGGGESEAFHAPRRSDSDLSKLAELDYGMKTGASGQNARPGAFPVVACRLACGLRLEIGLPEMRIKKVLLFRRGEGAGLLWLV